MKDSPGVRIVVVTSLALVMAGTACLTWVAILRWNRAEEYAKARELLNITYDRNVHNQWSAADDIVRMGRPAIPALSDALWEENERTRYWAAYCLGRIGPTASAAAPDLLAVIQNQYETRDVRTKAAEALGRIGPEAKAIVSDLLPLLKDPSVGYLAGDALRKIDPEEAKKAGVPNIRFGF